MSKQKSKVKHFEGEISLFNRNLIYHAVADKQNFYSVILINLDYDTSKSHKIEIAVPTNSVIYDGKSYDTNYKFIMTKSNNELHDMIYSFMWEIIAQEQHENENVGS